MWFLLENGSKIEMIFLEFINLKAMIIGFTFTKERETFPNFYSKKFHKEICRFDEISCFYWKPLNSLIFLLKNKGFKLTLHCVVLVPGCSILELHFNEGIFPCICKISSMKFIILHAAIIARTFLRTIKIEIISINFPLKQTVHGKISIVVYEYANIMWITPVINITVEDCILVFDYFERSGRNCASFGWLWRLVGDIKLPKHITF